MTVTLPPAVAKAVSELMEEGFFDSPEEILAVAVQALAAGLDRDRKRAELRAEIRKGIESLNAGRSQPLTDELIEEIKAGIRRRRAERPAEGAA